ncbi:MAG: hypothetical protein R8M11_08075 [Gallionella sp.]
MLTKIFYFFLVTVVALFSWGLLFVAMGKQINFVLVFIVLMPILGLISIFLIRMRSKKSKRPFEKIENPSVWPLTKPLTHSQPGTFLVLGFALYLLALYEFNNPAIPRSTDRWGWFYILLYEQLGLFGSAIWYSFLGTIFVVVDLLETKKNKGDK